jgi:hypothetical protein
MRIETDLDVSVFYADYLHSAFGISFTHDADTKLIIAEDEK